MPAPSLDEVQRLFWESIAAQPRGESIAPAFMRLVRGSDDCDRKARIRVYSDAYFLRLRDVLREDFPRLAALLGPDQLDELVKCYLEAIPSRSFSVRDLGHLLSGFLRQRRALTRSLADLAELEWARIEVFDAPDAECATIDDLGHLPFEAWPTLRFSTIPALRILHTQYPAHQVWCGDSSLEVALAETSLRVWRTSDGRVLHSPMDERESAALQKMRSGEPFAAICEIFADLPENVAAQEATALLARWIHDGIVARIGSDVPATSHSDASAWHPESS